MNQESSKGKIKNFTDLVAWQEAHKLVLIVYKLARKFPEDEKFGLTIQIKRAVVSITSNIAEGFGRNMYRDKTQFYVRALGSVTEVHNQLLVARDVGYITADDFRRATDQSIAVNKLLNGLIKSSKSLISNS
jgi:four helix bundle protein